MYQIGQVAELSGFRPKTLRFYEEQGILRPARRSKGGFRLYDEHTLARLHFIRKAKALNFSLAEIRRIVRLRESGHAPCTHVHSLLKAKLRDARQHLTELKRLAGDLEEHVTRMDHPA
jgi:DNA-binding transcriptional MerR regulator